MTIIMETNSILQNENIRASTKPSSPRNSRSANQLYLAMLAILVLSVVRIVVHEVTHVREHLQELHSPHHLDIKRFTQMTPDQDFRVQKSDNNDATKEKGSINIEIKEQAGSDNKRQSEVQPYIDILQRAGVKGVKLLADPDIVKKLPLKSDVEDLYGSEPVIIGLETCKTFRETIDPGDAYVGPAGMFNTVSFVSWSRNAQTAQVFCFILMSTLFIDSFFSFGIQCRARI